MTDFKPQFNSDSYFVVDNDKIFYSKLRAIEAVGGDMSRIHFSWMEDLWSTVDWTIEPQVSWNELLRIRCQQIRDKYDYVALWYSSGYDSHTILRSFVDNNILLDELLIFDRSEFFTDPEVEIALNHAKYIKQTYYPHLKINLVHVSHKSLSNYYLRHGSDWIYHTGGVLKLGKTTRYFCTMELPEFMESIAEINRGDIMGIDKPKVLLRDNCWYAFCTDGNLCDYAGSKQENFYWSPQLPELHLKQVHMVISWFESLHNLTEDLVHDVQGRNRTINKELHELYYKPWNIGMGRLPMYYSHEYSRNGNHKLYSHMNSEYSPDFLSYYNHIKNSDNKIFKIYNDSLLQARRYDTPETGQLVEKTLLSKQYYIRPRFF